jgi:hypothetical protein
VERVYYTPSDPEADAQPFAGIPPEGGAWQWDASGYYYGEFPCHYVEYAFSALADLIFPNAANAGADAAYAGGGTWARRIVEFFYLATGETRCAGSTAADCQPCFAYPGETPAGDPLPTLEQLKKQCGIYHPCAPCKRCQNAADGCGVPGTNRSQVDGTTYPDGIPWPPPAGTCPCATCCPGVFCYEAVWSQYTGTGVRPPTDAVPDEHPPNTLAVIGLDQNLWVAVRCPGDTGGIQQISDGLQWDYSGRCGYDSWNEAPSEVLATEGSYSQFYLRVRLVGSCSECCTSWEPQEDCCRVGVTPGREGVSFLAQCNCGDLSIFPGDVKEQIRACYGDAWPPLCDNNACDNSAWPVCPDSCDCCVWEFVWSATDCLEGVTPAGKADCDCFQDYTPWQAWWNCRDCFQGNGADWSTCLECVMEHWGNYNYGGGPGLPANFAYWWTALDASMLAECRAAFEAATGVDWSTTGCDDGNGGYDVECLKDAGALSVLGTLPASCVNCMVEHGFDWVAYVDAAGFAGGGNWNGGWMPAPCDCLDCLGIDGSSCWECLEENGGSQTGYDNCVESKRLAACQQYHAAILGQLGAAFSGAGWTPDWTVNDASVTEDESCDTGLRCTRNIRFTCDDLCWLQDEGAEEYEGAFYEYPMQAELAAAIESGAVVPTLSLPQQAYCWRPAGCPPCLGPYTMSVVENGSGQKFLRVPRCGFDPGNPFP